MKRITFIRKGTFSILAMGLMFALLFSTSCKNTEKYPDDYGLALYTVRDAMNTDPVKTLHQVADMGYSYVEAAGYNLEKGTFYGFSPEEFKKMCDEAGLKLVTSHTGVEQLLDENGDFDEAKATKMIDDHARVGVKYLVNAHISDKYSGSVEGYKAIADACNKLGEMAEKKGFGVLYHNHSFEFKPIGDTDGFTILTENLAPQLVNFELDCYWAEKAGKDPVTLITLYPGRFKALHLKDMTDDADKSFAEVGYGTMDYKAIIATGLKNGVEYFLVEQDRSKRDPMESARMSIDYLKKIDAEDQGNE
ncbi:MAG TPA: sugar phosphate isomerase/epimerase [Bacteroidales bacterium]|nr:sugar phosphate isomerase/epimerase [Bacteroidales bacterium]